MWKISISEVEVIFSVFPIVLIVHHSDLMTFQNRTSFFRMIPEVRREKDVKYTITPSVIVETHTCSIVNCHVLGCVLN